MIEHGGNIYRIAKILDIDLSNILDFSANINPLGYPQGLEEYLSSYINSIVHYPDPEYNELIEAIAEYIGVRVENILVGNGAIDIISLCIQTVETDRVLIPIPTFSEYARIAKINGLTVEYFYTGKEFTFNIEDIVKEIKQNRVGMLILCNPNNPTGRLIDVNSLRYLLDEALKLSVFVMIDEAFIEFTENYPKSSAVSFVNLYSNLCIVRCFTKFFGLPGLRLGYVVASIDFINRMKERVLPWSVNVLADLAGRYVLKDKAFMKETRKVVSSERALLIRELSNLNWIFLYPSQANFILARLSMDASILEKFLLDQGILIRNCSNFNGLDRHYIRLAVKDHKSNLRLIEALKSFRYL
ncbi:MAG: threonine-phosphate decarboxylase CobD [bacterium]